MAVRRNQDGDEWIKVNRVQSILHPFEVVGITGRLCYSYEESVV